MAARDERNLLSMAQPYDRLNLGGIAREHDGARRGAKMNERVGFVRQQIGRIPQHAGRPDNGGERVEKGAVRWKIACRNAL